MGGGTGRGDDRFKLEGRCEKEMRSDEISRRENRTTTCFSDCFDSFRVLFFLKKTQIVCVFYLLALVIFVFLLVNLWITHLVKMDSHVRSDLFF